MFVLWKCSNCGEKLRCLLVYDYKISFDFAKTTYISLCTGSNDLDRGFLGPGEKRICSEKTLLLYHRIHCL